jgi:hypothetical protein
MILAVAVGLAPAAGAQEKAVEMPGWLSGYWLMCAGGVEVSETWSDPRGGQMLGSSITMSKGKASWEQNRIGPSAAGISFFADPSGQTPAEFPLAKDKSSEMRLVFENPTHDFPQRVILGREGDMLVARIEGTLNGKAGAENWRYRKAQLNERCPARP